MASSSSSSQFDPASSSQSWNYHVFLSFRGEDTRKTFVDHLYWALVDRLICTYKDEETLPRGESIGPSLMKAIEDSQIAIIIFSKNYADSSWCLEELAYIMKCREESGKIVLPIFYHVDPSEVRKQEGEFGHAFARKEEKNYSKAESWRKALMDASNIAGWEVKHIANGHEAEAINKIVDIVSTKVFPSTPYVDNALVGMRSRLEDFKSQLQIGSGGVRMVGIWGVGGGGKTTLATSAYMELCHHFDGYCNVENIREESNKYGLKTLQEKFLSAVLKTHVTVQSVEQGKHMIKSRLCHSRVLILLDDVDDRMQLEALAGSHNWFGDGSRIIITTRDEHLLKIHKVDEICHVRLLFGHESVQLFNRHAYNKDEPVEDYETLSQLVISYADGLPLALIVLGSFLYDKDKNEWMSTLARLENIPETEIVEKLKISYDGLKPVEKELFLDIACFFRMKMIDETMEILDACGFHPGIGITVLRQKSLITTQYGKYDMHDLVHEMALYIVRGDHPNNPEEHSRVWQYKDIQHLCYGNLATIKRNDKIEAVQYDCHSDSPSPHLFRFLSNLKKLRSLRVYTHSNAYAEGPDFLSNELRYMQMTCETARALPVDFHLTKLVVLKLDNSLQEELWKGYKYLPNMRTLELHRLYNLIETPNFDGLPNLERFILCGSSHLKEIHPSIGRLERLVCLIVQGCYRLKMFPPINASKKLETVVLSGCCELFKVSEIRQNPNIRYVETYLDKSWKEFASNLSSCGIHGVFKVSNQPIGYGFQFEVDQGCVANVCKLVAPKMMKEKLDCTSFFVSCLTSCSNKLDGDTHADIVDAECYFEEPFLPQNNITNYIGLQAFSRSLRKLDLRWCNLVDENMCSDLLELTNLQQLDLRGNNFSRLDFSLLQFPQLKWLDVSSCTNLVKLLDIPSSIAVLIAENCCSLESVGDISHCKWLWKVSLMGENKIGTPDGDVLLDSMFQGNAIEQHFISFTLTDVDLWKRFERRCVWKKRFTLQLPRNWKNEFSGFLITTVSQAFNTCMTVDVTNELYKDCQSEVLKTDHHPTIYVGYVSFTSLQHTSWLKSACNIISFCVRREYELPIIAELVPRRSKSDPTEMTNMPTEFWEEHEDRKTFVIQEDSKSCINILWHPCNWY